jgi:molybdopterin synthase sulfur carrier subunit
MKVSVRGYLTLADVVERREWTAEDGTTLRGLLVAVAAQSGPTFAASIYDPACGLQAGVAVLVNGRSRGLEAGLDTPLRDGDEVAIFPPIAGGDSIGFCPPMDDGPEFHRALGGISPAGDSTAGIPVRRE